MKDTDTIPQFVSDLINGNLTDAKRRARSKPHRVIRQAYQDATGCADGTAVAAADYLKGECSFQAFCDTAHHNGDR